MDRLGRSLDCVLDHATIVDFLTSTAGALSGRGLLTSKDSDSLRVALSGTPKEPLLVALERQRADFLAMLEARYGRVGYCLNLLRYSLRGPLAETQRHLGDFGRDVVKKAELLFNRPFHIYQQGACERQALYSTVLVDFSETLQGVLTRVTEALDELRRMNGHAMAGDSEADGETDLAVAHALGFTSVTRGGRPGRVEAAAKRQIALALEDLAEEALILADQLAANAGHQDTYGVALGCDQLKAECVRLAHLELPLSGSVIAWEIRRRALLDAMTGVNEALQTVARSTLALIGADMPKDATPRHPEAVKRRIAFDLIASGTPAGKAHEAAEGLFQYLARQGIRAAEMIPGELPRIHPMLTAKCLETMSAIERDASIMSQASEEKARTLGRAQKLSDAFARGMILLLSLGSIALGGCGLKTRPSSDVPELRPDIPYRAVQELPPKPAKETSK